MVILQPVSTVIDEVEGGVAIFQIELFGSIEKTIQFTIETMDMSAQNLATACEYIM